MVLPNRRHTLHLHWQHAPMTTQASFIAFNDTFNDSLSASSDSEEDVPPVNDPAIDAAEVPAGGLVQHATPALEDLSEEDLPDQPKHPLHESNELVSPTLLSVLFKNRAGTWFSSQRSRHPVWSFFCPSDSSLGWEERGKAVHVDCLICHATRYAGSCMSTAFLVLLKDVINNTVCLQDG